MKPSRTVFHAALLGALAIGQAQADEKLATASGCMACHKIDTKIVGPSFKEIAAKYKGDAGAEAALIDKVKKGGSGTWGAVPMPANSPRVSDSDIKNLVDWILAM